jgi:hypothetical protein
VTNESEKKDRRTPFENAGKRAEEEIEKLISYLNDEVVPSVRKQSTKGMRVAAEKLNWLADFMEQKQSPEPPAQSSESDKGATKS